jgi:uncharacterized protein (DUF58 family)
LPGSRESKPSEGGLSFLPLPQTQGIFTLLLILLAFAAGLWRKELALTLSGAVFLIIAAYCFIGVLAAGLSRRKKPGALTAYIPTRSVTAGRTAELELRRGDGGGDTGRPGRPVPGLRFRWPGVLVRYELRLETRDGKKLSRFFDPGISGEFQFVVEKRGAYYGSFDALVITDAAGFFRLAFPVPQDASPRLLASPVPAEEPIPVSIRSGGKEHRNEVHYRKTDDLTDHRPYIPGDDPRRINWKLYGHMGDLFVREGEPEPPPHSRLLILIDSQAEGALYGAEEARRGVDLLCEHALAIGLEYASRGMDILTAYTGAKGLESNLTAALAHPAALPLSSPEELPPAAEDRSFLILALPRLSAEPAALDRFLKKRPPGQGADILFLYEGEGRDEAAETCVAVYNRRGGVTARRVRVRV